MNTLFIDTSSNTEVSVGLEIGGKTFVEKRQLDRKKAQVVLPMIDSLLKTHQIKLENIEAVEVNVGPGSFTGLRVGVSIANTLSKELNIPINGKKPGTLVEPVYS